MLPPREVYVLLECYFTLFIHFRTGPLTELSGLPGENTSDMWLCALNTTSVG